MVPDLGGRSKPATSGMDPASQQTSMARYYWRLLRLAPGLAAKAGNGALGWIGVVVIVLFLVNRELGKAVASWDGVSPWWALAPFGTLLLFGLLRANHQEFAALEKTANTASQELTAIRSVASDEAEKVKKQREIAVASLARGRTIGRIHFDDIDRVSNTDDIDEYFAVSDEVYKWERNIRRVCP
jgi:hypothetical protein